MNAVRSNKERFEVDLTAQEAARLREYAERKGMSPEAVFRQALRAYDLMEQTPAGYGAVNTVARANLGPKLLSEAEASRPQPVDRDRQVKELLETHFWISTLELNTRYARGQDDHDGTFTGNLSVAIGEDGDIWVSIDGAGVRFRMPGYGGGMSPYTRTALMILAEAIRRDNLERPLKADSRG